MNKTSTFSLKNILGSNLFSVGIWIALLSLVAGNLKFFDHYGAVIIPSTKVGFAISAGCFLLAYFINKKEAFHLNIFTFGFGLFFLLISNWCIHPYNLVQGPWIRGEILVLAIISGLLVFKNPDKFIKYLPWVCSLILIYSFFSTSNGRILHSDDHPTFFYRLSLLKLNFPNIPFYYPGWNGGYDARDFFATGALNLFLLASPIIYLFPLASSYNFIIATVLFIVVPLCAYFAVRIAHGNSRSAAIAAVISMSSSLLWYRWILKYGTMGFFTTASLFPLMLSFAIRILKDKDFLNWKKLIFFAVFFTLMLFWSPSGLAFLPLVLIALIYSPRLIKRPKVVYLGILLCALNLPWISIFWSVSKVSSFLESEAAQEEVVSHIAAKGEIRNVSYKHKTGEINFKKSLKVFREDTVTANPLILLLAVPGIFLISKNLRWIFISIYLWLLFLGTIVVPLKPQMEFDRMLVILYQTLSFPCGLLIDKMISDSIDNAWYRKLITSFVIGILIAGIFSTSGILSNRTLEQFSFSRSISKELADALEENTSTGRVLFSGFVLHEYNDGHVAPLPIKTGKPMIASSPVHNMWQYKQIFPKEYIQAGDEGIEKYLDIYNVETIVAHERLWRNYFYDHPDKYKLLWKKDLFHVFRYKNFKDSYFLSGNGDFVSQTSNAIYIKPKTSEIVLKFNYFPFLQASECKISGEEISKHVKFIKLSGCPLGKEIKISSVSAFKRIGFIP